MMDAIFGRANFRNAIVWRRYGSHNDARNYGRVYDVLLYYVKENVGVWNRAYSDLDPIYIEKTYRLSDERGRYRTAPLHTGGLSGGGYEYEFRGFTRTWRYPKERMEELERNNLIRQARNGEGIPERKVYLEDSKGIPLSNLWDDIGALTGNHNERTGYPTQKPLALYERIIKASSNEGDIVLDPFAGCATTCVAAERLGRGWIGIDINKPARKVIQERLKSEINKSMAWGKLVKTPSKPPMRTDGGQEAAPELVLVSHKPRAPRLSARELRSRLVIADGLKCQGCGWIPHHEEYMEVDHRVPKSRGGRDDLRNRVLLCGPCNGTKGNKLTLAELRRRRLDEGRMEDKSWDEEWYEREGRFG